MAASPSTGGARKLNTLRRRDVPILFPSSRLSFEAWQLATELGMASLIEAVMLRRGIVHEFVIRLKNLSVDLANRFFRGISVSELIIRVDLPCRRINDGCLSNLAAE
jgi:hypothetical protein